VHSEENNFAKDNNKLSSADAWERVLQRLTSNDNLQVMLKLRAFLPQPDLMTLLRIIMSRFLDEPYLAENWDDEAMMVNNLWS